VFGATVVLDRDRVIPSLWPPDRRTRIVKHWPDELQNVTVPNDASRRIADSVRLVASGAGRCARAQICQIGAVWRAFCPLGQAG